MNNNLFRIVLLFFFCSAILLLNSCGNKDDASPNFEGSWTTVETSRHFGNTTFTMPISTSSSDKSTLIIKNFYNLGASTNAIGKVSGNNITLDAQQVSAQNIHGSGSYSNGKINWTYYTDDGVNRDTCTAVSSK